MVDALIVHLSNNSVKGPHAPRLCILCCLILKSFVVNSYHPGQVLLSISGHEEEKTRLLLWLLVSICLMRNSFFSFIIVFVITVISVEHTVVNGLGVGSTVAISYSTATVCGIIAGDPIQSIRCYQNGHAISVPPHVSFEAISGGSSFFCGLRDGGLSIYCWDTVGSFSFQPKHIVNNQKVPLSDLTVGDDQVCAVEVLSGIAACWRGGTGKTPFPSPSSGLEFSTITSGNGFSCGILLNNSRVFCWGDNAIGEEIQNEFGERMMSSLVAGDSHACGLTSTGSLVCKGSNEYGQLDVPSSSDFEFSGLAAGSNFTCAIRRKNGLVVCWGERKGLEYYYDTRKNVAFEAIVAGLNFICGLTSRNLTLICWGPGWPNQLTNLSDLPVGMILPGPCLQASCSGCGVYPNSGTLCGGSGNICRPCQTELPLALPLPPLVPPSEEAEPDSRQGKTRNRLVLPFLILGLVGAFAGTVAVLYWLWMRLARLLHNRIYDSVQHLVTDSNSSAAAMANNGSITPALRSSSLRHHSSRRLERQLSGSSSSSKHADWTQKFSLSELADATENFSSEHKIGQGSFGTVYKGLLVNGYEVAIKRGEKMKKNEEKESAFDAEVVLLSRLHHKHLVGLVGFCHEKDERLLVYEYMSNGALHDHLHSTNNAKKTSSILNSWKIRIKIALDAARGIEYLHNYAVPPIIHRDIKSSNILLDTNWTAKVSDFGLSLMGPDSDQEFMSTKAVGTVGYIDPEYYVLNVLTAKSDIYGLGVVLLELLTGIRAVFKNESGPMGVVEHASPRILAGNLLTILDKRVGPPGTKEVEAVQLTAYTALRCVSLEGKQRPNVSEVVAKLEKALSLCEDGHGSFFITTSSPSSKKSVTKDCRRSMSL